MACPIVGSVEGYFLDDHKYGMRCYYGSEDYCQIQYIVNILGLTEVIDKLSFCFANSFVLNKSKVVDFLNITKHIKIQFKVQSEFSERYLAPILYVLNNYTNYSIENIKFGDPGNSDYVSKNKDHKHDYYFTKFVTNKNELTLDK